MSKQNSKKDKRVCLGAFAGAHGVHGQVKVKSFTGDPTDISAYGALISEDGTRHFTLKVIRILKGDLLLTSSPDIKTREEAESLKGIRLYVNREDLPEPEADEFYLTDLVGLKVISPEGEPLGLVKAVHNFGAGDILEISNIPGTKGVKLVAFTKENVPVLNIINGELTLTPAALIEQTENDKV